MYSIRPLELFCSSKNTELLVPLELDLICQYDNANYFEALFGGVNQFRFTKIPKVGIAYSREIILDPRNRLITYRLTNLKRISESFQLGVRNVNGNVSQLEKDELVKMMTEMIFLGSQGFTGIEWRNIMENRPFPIRFGVEISMLTYAQKYSADMKRLEYRPYNLLVPATDKSGKQYPISFANSRRLNNCICFEVSKGNTTLGLRYRSK